MNPIYDRFVDFLLREDKAGAIQYAIELLENKAIAVADLYEMILAPALNRFHCPENDSTCIWREHVRTSIVRSVIEVCYPYVLKAKEAPGFVAVHQTALVVCPPEEYREIGARMAADFFELAGFDVVYVGANTPNRDILSAVEHVRPRVVAVSVTNYYNLIKAHAFIEAIADRTSGHPHRPRRRRLPGSAPHPVRRLRRTAPVLRRDPGAGRGGTSDASVQDRAPLPQIQPRPDDRDHPRHRRRRLRPGLHRLPDHRPADVPRRQDDRQFLPGHREDGRRRRLHRRL
ncbi:MAG: cobalamin-dependent protein [Bacillus subtilis]|nr:cobalamin-dependent protein [Bacillus subtilis]